MKTLAARIQAAMEELNILRYYITDCYSSLVVVDCDSETASDKQEIFTFSQSVVKE